MWSAATSRQVPTCTSSRGASDARRPAEPDHRGPAQRDRGDALRGHLTRPGRAPGSDTVRHLSEAGTAPSHEGVRPLEDAVPDGCTTPAREVHPDGRAVLREVRREGAVYRRSPDVRPPRPHVGRLRAARPGARRPRAAARAAARGPDAGAGVGAALPHAPDRRGHAQRGDRPGAQDPARRRPGRQARHDPRQGAGREPARRTRAAIAAHHVDCDRGRPRGD